MSKKVEEQKGPIKAHQESYRTETRPMKEREASDEIRMKRDNQSLKEHRPKQ